MSTAPPPRRRILFFAYYFPPLGGPGSLRALSFVQHLPSHGWDVTVITPREGIYGTDPGLQSEEVPGVRVVRTASFEPATMLRGLRASTADSTSPGGAYVDEVRLGRLGSALRGLVRRWLYFPDAAIGWVHPAVREARRLHRERPFEVVLSSSPPVSAHVAASRFSRKAGIPWIADWRDVWGTDVRSGKIFGRRAHRLEKQLVERCSGLVGATEGVTRIQCGDQAGNRPRVTIRNGYEPGEFKGATPPAQPAFNVVYAGTVYGRAIQDMAGLFEAVRSLAAKEGRDRLRVTVLGKCDPSNRSLPEELGIPDLVEFEGFLPHGEVISRLRTAGQVLLMGSGLPSDVGRAGVPAKTFECLASGRPVLVLSPADTELAELIGKVPGVTVCDFADVPAIECSIRKAMLGGREPGPAPLDFLKGFTRRAQAARLASFLEEVLQGRCPVL